MFSHRLRAALSAHWHGVSLGLTDFLDTPVLEIEKAVGTGATGGKQKKSAKSKSKAPVPDDEGLGEPRQEPASARSACPRSG